MGYGGSGVTSDLGRIGSFLNASSFAFEGTVPGPSGPVFAAARLPIFVGTEGFKVPIDFMDATRGPAGRAWTTS